MILSFIWLSAAGVAPISEVNHEMDCRTAWFGVPPHGTPGHCTKGTLFTRGLLYFKVWLKGGAIFCAIFCYFGVVGHTKISPFLFPPRKTI